MGESTVIILITALIILLGAVITLGVLYQKLHKKLRSFTAGRDGASLEATLSWLTAKVAHIDDTLESHKEGLEHIDARVARSIRGTSLIKYNAYADAGGEQSFALGLLDEHADGCIISIITNRNHVGIYAKRIIAGGSDHSLTTEEKEALIKAKASLN